MDEEEINLIYNAIDVVRDELMAKMGIITHLEERLETHEQLISTLLVSFLDVASGLEVLMHTMVESMDSTEDQKNFAETVAKQRNEMLDQLKAVVESQGFTVPPKENIY